jgi:hypothetical protein
MSVTSEKRLQELRFNNCIERKQLTLAWVKNKALNQLLLHEKSTHSNKRLLTAYEAVFIFQLIKDFFSEPQSFLSI